MSRYLLLPHVHVCWVNGHAVFLDLSRDDYLGLGRADTVALRRILQYPLTQDRLVAAESRLETPRDNFDDRIGIQLVEHGLLTTDVRRGRRPHPAPIPTPSKDFSTEHCAPFSNGSAAVLHFFWACGWASASLRWRRLNTVVSGIEYRKRQTHHAVSIERLHELVTTFSTLRPFFSRPYVCLYDSLALLEFLALHEIFPTWVFGVQMEPFGAHCWIQEGDVVLNDSVEAVSQYTPIMAV